MEALKLFPVTIEFPRASIAEPAAEVAALISTLPDDGGLRGASVALALGSRKIAGIAQIASVVVDFLKARGARPFVVPAMGSHGGGSAASQKKVLEHLGILEEMLGVPVVSEEALVEAGQTGSGIPVWVDRAAWEADFIVPINRVKPHTAFRAAVESGPSKLLAVGLGKSRSAETLHRAGLAKGIPEVVEFFLSEGKLPFGLALAENAWSETALMALLTPQDWLGEEAKLLTEAWKLYPRLPWKELDLLIVEKMGKDISGTGMDMNVIGMNRRFREDRSPPRIKRIVALDLSDGADGNATGVGYADFITERLASKVDWHKTAHNCAVSGFTEAALKPPVAATEEEAIRLALSSAGLDAGSCRAVRIKSTSSLVNVQVSPALMESLPQTVRRG